MTGRTVSHYEILDPSGRGRNGRDLPRQGHAAQPHGGRQGSAQKRRGRRYTPAAVHAGGAGGIRAEPSQHHHGTRHPLRRWNRSAGDGTGCRQDTGGTGAGHRPADPAGAQIRGADCQRAGGGPRGGNRASGHQAGQHHGHWFRAGEGAGFRAGQAHLHGSGQRFGQDRQHIGSLDGARHGGGYGQLHVAGAGRGQERSTAARTSSRSAFCCTRW